MSYADWTGFSYECVTWCCSKAGCTTSLTQNVAHSDSDNKDNPYVRLLDSDDDDDDIPIGLLVQILEVDCKRDRDQCHNGELYFRRRNKYIAIFSMVLFLVPFLSIPIVWRSH